MIWMPWKADVFGAAAPRGDNRQVRASLAAAIGLLAAVAGGVAGASSESRVYLPWLARHDTDDAQIVGRLGGTTRALASSSSTSPTPPNRRSSRACPPWVRRSSACSRGAA